MSERLGQDRLLSTLRAALRQSRWPAVATLHAHDLDVARFGESRVHQPQAMRNHEVTVRVFRDGRCGTASTNELSPEAIGRVLARAAEAATAMPPLPAGFPVPGERDGGRDGDGDGDSDGDGDGDGDGNGGDGDGGRREDTDARDARATERAYDATTAALSPADKAIVLGGIFGAARAAGVRFAGAYKTGVSERAVVDTSGLARYFASTFAELGLWALKADGVGDVSAWQGSASNRVGDINPAKLAGTAVERCLLSTGPAELDPGPHDVVLAPRALGELLDWMAMTGFDAKSHLAGTGFLAGREGQQITGERVSLVDDADSDDPVAFPLPFDDDGVSSSPVALIERGRAVGPVHSRHSGARAGCSSTGHARIGGLSPDSGGTPARLCFAAGDQTERQLIAGVERGIYVTRFHYVNGMLDPRKALMTGLTRDGAFLVEDGRLKRGIRNLRFTDSILAAFQRIDGIGSTRQAVPAWWMDSGIHLCPALRIRDFVFTGRQELGVVD